MLDAYANGWNKGDFALIYEVIDDSYTFLGPLRDDPVDKEGLQAFLMEFRSVNFCLSTYVKRNGENLTPNPMILLQEYCRESWRSRHKLDQLYDIQEYNSKKGNLGIIQTGVAEGRE